MTVKSSGTCSFPCEGFAWCLDKKNFPEQQCDAAASLKSPKPDLYSLFDN